MNQELEYIDIMIARLKALKSTINKKDKQSDKTFKMSSHSLKQLQKADVDLSWLCMQVDKEKTDFARAFKGSILDVGTEEKEYRPSGFHTYKH